MCSEAIVRKKISWKKYCWWSDKNRKKSHIAIRNPERDIRFMQPGN